MTTDQTSVEAITQVLHELDDDEWLTISTVMHRTGFGYSTVAVELRGLVVSGAAVRRMERGGVWVYRAVDRAVDGEEGAE